MSDFFTALQRWLSEIRARVNATHLTTGTLRSLAKTHPTCRIMSTTLSEVVVGEYVAILGGAILDRVNISDFSYISNDSVVRNAEIGKFCSIGSCVQIGLAPHPSRVFVSTSPAFYSTENPGCTVTFQKSKRFDDAVPRTRIANDVWVGANAIVPGGVRIGTGAIVAAGAVVVKDIPPYAVVGGNPAQVIRYRFPEAYVQLLLKSEWWNWPVEDYFQHTDEFSDIEKFIGGATNASTSKP